MVSFAQVSGLAWSAHLVNVLMHCGDGLGNRGVSGHLSGWQCALGVRGAGQFRLPLQSDAIIVAGLVTAIAAAAGASMARGWGRHLAFVPPVALLVVGMPMGLRAWSERAMDRMTTLYSDPSAPEFGVGGSVLTDGSSIRGRVRF